MRAAFCLTNRRARWGDLLDVRQVEHALLVFLCFAAVLPLLFIARSADTNTFTSWRWVFSGRGVLEAMALLVPAMLVAHAGSRVSLPARARTLLVVAVPAAAVLPLWSEPETIIDASRYFLQAKSIAEYGASHFVREWGRGIDAWTDLPLVPFLYGLVFSWLGESRTCIQAFNTVLFALTALLTCRIGQLLWDDETGLHAGLLLAGIPFLLVQVPLLLVDVATMFFLTLSTWTFLSVLRRGGALRILACALAVSAAALSKYSAWPMLLVVLAASVAVQPERRTALTRALAVLLATAAILAPVLAARADVLLEQLRLLRGYQWSGLGRWQEGFLSTFLFQSHPFLAGLAVFGALRAARARDARFLVAASSVAVVVLLRLERARYVVPLLPLFVLMASYGLAEIGDRRSRRLVSLCIVATSLVVAYSAYLPFLRGTSLANIARAGEYLDATEGASVEVYAVPQRTSSGSTFAAIPLLDYYTARDVVSSQPWPFHGEDAVTRASSLRFTWELRAPPFYSGAARGDAPVVVISDGAPAELPSIASSRERARFDATSDVFKYQTVVTVYSRD
jgi:4-amino-4-deoxy-L-arabinose transferase-like glycosyltransferase